MTKEKRNRVDAELDSSVEEEEEVDYSSMTTDQLCRLFFPTLRKGQSDLKEIAKNQDKEITTLKKTVIKMQDKIDELTAENDKLYMMANRNYLIISGIDEGEASNTVLKTNIEDLIRKQIGSDIQLDTAERVGKPKEDMPRYVKVRCITITDKNTIFENRKLLGEKIYVSNDLSKSSRSSKFAIKRAVNKATEEGKKTQVNWKNHTLEIDGLPYETRDGRVVPVIGAHP